MNDTPFNRIIKSNNDIYLIPKSGIYNYIFIFIHGLYAKSETYVNGKPTTSWFNISPKYGKEIKEDSIDLNQLEISSNRIKKIIKEEAELLNNDYSKIFLSGFSQGACVSFHVGLTLEKLLGSIICLCGMPLSSYEIKENNKNLLNILVILGGKDPFFKEEYVKEKIKNILDQRNNLVIKIYENNAHHVYDDEMDYVKKYVLNLLNKNG